MSIWERLDASYWWEPIPMAVFGLGFGMIGE